MNFSLYFIVSELIFSGFITFAYIMQNAIFKHVKEYEKETEFKHQKNIKVLKSLMLLFWFIGSIFIYSYINILINT
tara:strand:- start:289 stop:516 length:228 start_codon:yes stop_codon:yes gene_type:complete